MRRIVMVLTVMAILVVALAVPAFASAGANRSANCVGREASGLNEIDERPGWGGQAISIVAREIGGLGERATTC